MCAKAVKGPSLARSVPKPPKEPSLARSVPKLLKVPSRRQRGTRYDSPKSIESESEKVKKVNFEVLKLFHKFRSVRF